MKRILWLVLLAALAAPARAAKPLRVGLLTVAGSKPPRRAPAGRRTCRSR